MSEYSWELLWLVTLEVVEGVGDMAGIKVADEAAGLWVVPCCEMPK